MNPNWRRLMVAVVLSVLCWIGSGIPAWATEIPLPVQQLQTQVKVLTELADQREWLEIRSYIRGPMGMVRKSLTAVERELPQTKRQQMVTTVRKLTGSLERMDLAAQSYDEARLQTAKESLRSSLRDLNQLLAG